MISHAEFILTFAQWSRTGSCLSEVNGTKRPWNNQKRNQQWLRYSTLCFCADERGTVRISVAVTGHGVWLWGSHLRSGLTHGSFPPLRQLVRSSRRAWALDQDFGHLPSCPCAGCVTTATWATFLSLGFSQSALANAACHMGVGQVNVVLISVFFVPRRQVALSPHLPNESVEQGYHHQCCRIIVGVESLSIKA